MSDVDNEKVKSHYSVTSRVYRDHYDPANLRASRQYPAEYFRLRNLLKRLRETGAKRVLDAGCGEGTPLVRVAELGCEVRGFDFTPEMIEDAKANFSANGLDPDSVVVADIEDYASFGSLGAGALYDAAVCFGVMPHVSDVSRALANLRKSLKAGGRAYIEFRNALFDLLTMNRLTHDFIIGDLLEGVPEKIRTATSEDLSARLAMDKPPQRTTEVGGKPGYDVIRAKRHNPLTLPQVFAAAGFGTTIFHWYHFHPTLPMLEGNSVPTDAFREAAFAMEENPSDWRGHFLCSAFVVEAVAA